MIHITDDQIKALDRIPRLTLINSITGFKPANLVGTADGKGNTNLAVISSVVHLGSDPALVAFIMRPMVTERHTMENILETGVFTLNHIHAEIAQRAHFTSADFPREASEFDKCKLSPFYLPDFHAPFVAESKIRIGLTLAEKFDIAINKTVMVIGQVSHILMEGSYLRGDMGINLIEAGTICISGLDSYHPVTEGESFPYARPENTPDF
jgi:flavin reductase (DIM6/NTAB) family NADH-FMN oxidoreductase RutF